MSSSLGNNGGRLYSTLVKPVLLDCSFTVAAADTGGLGITGLTGAGIKNVFMHTSQTPGSNNGYLNPNPNAGYALIQLKSGYNKYVGGFSSQVAPLTGSNLAINGSALSLHVPYVITAVGAGSNGAVTIAPVADSSGSLASTWFKLFDAYGNTFIIWFKVSGVGSAPSGVSGTLVQQSIATNDTAATIGAALVTTIANLASGISGVNSFTAAGTTTVTATSTAARPNAGPPSDGTAATGFTFAQTVFKTNLQCWQGVGLPKGLNPTIGQAFFATATGFSSNGSSTGTVKASSVSAITKIEMIGQANTTLYPVAQGGSPNVGGFLLLQFLAPTDASTTTLIPTNPTDGAVVRLAFMVEASSVVIAGE